MSVNFSPRPAVTPAALVVASAAMLMITIGVRQTSGLFVAPLHADTGTSVAAISFALAVGQLVWGFAQPVFGAIADKQGPLRVLIAGGVLLCAGHALAPVWTSPAGLVFSLGLLAAAGAAAGSFPVVIGNLSRHLPVERRSFAIGLVNAGGSFGQLLYAPLVQAAISVGGWSMAMLGLAGSALFTLPLAWVLGRSAGAGSSPSTAAGEHLGLGEQLRLAFRDRSYWCLHIGFFTCGLHIAFLTTHLPGEIALCGLPASVSAVSLALIGLFNIGGSIAVGVLGHYFRMKWLLLWVYASRALFIGVYLLAPPTPMVFYIFSAVLGLTWLATTPSTAGLVGKLFGPRYMGTLFGLTLVSHQIGAFFGAWLGGVAFERFGGYTWMWYADMVLALLAALVNLPIREPAANQVAAHAR